MLAQLLPTTIRPGLQTYIRQFSQVAVGLGWAALGGIGLKADQQQAVAARADGIRRLKRRDVVHAHAASFLRELTHDAPGLRLPSQLVLLPLPAVRLAPETETRPMLQRKMQ